MAQHHILSPRAGGGGGAADPAAYVPPPSIGHEIGVMCGGIGAMVIGAALFYLWWTMNLKREAKKEQERIEGLRARGLLGEEKY
ncbi:hypothetical protein H2201_002007 [Coniosporium apollinis]|uniref:Cytochrome c oxidase assembly protein COX20, mitochondrial n=1 Tax=Coniosporium apollinis TaxID=61459 RepID=A0ABQ9P3C1_9PEZI|nr:hypothetical protein H2201_002007 [Coniosporium apollinis]